MFYKKNHKYEHFTMYTNISKAADGKKKDQKI